MSRAQSDESGLKPGKEWEITVQSEREAEVFPVIDKAEPPIREGETPISVEPKETNQPAASNRRGSL